MYINFSEMAPVGNIFLQLTDMAIRKSQTPRPELPQCFFVLARIMYTYSLAPINAANTGVTQGATLTQYLQCT